MNKFINFRNLSFITTIISILSTIIAPTVNGYEYLFLMPLTYFACLLITKFDYVEYKNNISYISISILAFLKYSFMPIIIITSSDYYSGVLTSQIPNSNYIIYGIILCCIECISIFSILNLYLHFKVKNKSTPINNDIKIGLPMIIFMILSIFLIVIYKDGFFPSQFLVIDQTYENSIINSNFDGLVKIIFYLFKIYFLLFFTQNFIKKYRKSNKYIYLIGVFIVLLIYLLLNTSTSRWGLVLPVLVYLFVLRDVWFKNMRSKMIIYVVGVILSISFISISIFKFNWLMNDELNVVEIIKVLGTQVQEYLSGPRAIAQGIETIDVYRDNITFTTLLNDFIGSIPFVSHYINQDNRINVYYNYLLKGTERASTQIMPMITIGHAYFTLVFCNFFILLSIFLALYYGEKEKKSDDLFHKYIFSIISIRFALCIGFNTQIIFAWYVSNFIPFIFVLWLNKILKIRRIK